jgi:hypothetical protein
MISKNKILFALTTHPRLLTFGVGLAVTFTIGALIGTLDSSHSAYAFQNQENSGNNARDCCR